MTAKSTKQKVFGRLDIMISLGLESADIFIGRLAIASQFYFDLPLPLSFSSKHPVELRRVSCGYRAAVFC
jgi:hypothetical protein